VGCKSYGDKIKINDQSEVYYKDGATKEEAQKLGDFLLKNNYFDTKTEKSVQLTKDADTFDVRFVVDKARAQESLKETQETFSALGMLLSMEVFGGKYVSVMLADPYMKTFSEIKAVNLDTTNTANGPANKDSLEGAK
jgi:pectate lyase